MGKLCSIYEKQFLQFSDIVPYVDNDWTLTKSPLLASILLGIGPQIEAMTKIIFNALGFTTEKNKPGFWDYYPELNQKRMFTSHSVILKNSAYQGYKILHPFNELGSNTDNVMWWEAYNKLKHSLPEGLEYGSLQNTIHGLAALSSLLHIAYEIKLNLTKERDFILDSKNWHITNLGVFEGRNEWPPVQNPLHKILDWKSELFFFDNVLTLRV
ncbi:hypothetical protein [Nitrosopumilus adriaticus]|nr:hypothetical protein [Nitrosopumilus adriaticus]